ncbi:MAG: hypothetical protein Q4C87_00705 [Actinomycetaceae bacterium]|nr:hypothetical protein [Actinomycetaceae bacterium]
MEPFPAHYHCEVADISPRAADYENTEHDGFDVSSFFIVPPEADPYTLAVHGEKGGWGGLDVVLTGPSPTQLCIVIGGILYIGDVNSPQSFTYIPASRNHIFEYAVSVEDRVIVFSTHTNLFAVDSSGVRWESEPIHGCCFDLRDHRIDNGILYIGVDVPGLLLEDLAVDLKTGKISGGERLFHQ